jgi:hypothetical protein
VLLPSGVVFYTGDLNVLPGLDADAAQPLLPEEAARFFPASTKAGWTFTGMSLTDFDRDVRLVSGHCPEQA